MRLIIFIITIHLSLASSCQKYFGRIVSTPAVPVDSLANINIIADGNSYFANIGGTCSPTVLITLAPFSTNGATIYNFGVSGQTTGQMLSDQYSQVLSQYNSGVLTNVLLIQEGGNDIYYNGRVDSAIARMTRYCNNAKAAGFRVITSTLIHRDQTTPFGDNPTEYNTKIDNYNSALIALVGVYDGCIRPELESIFSTYESAGYYTDKVHPSQTGNNKYAELYKTAILAL